MQFENKLLHTYSNENKSANIFLLEADYGKTLGYKVCLYIGDNQVKEIRQFTTSEQYAEDTAENFVMGWGHFELDDPLD